MRTFTLTILLGSVLVVAGCQSAPKEGEKISALKIGTVDVMRVMEETPETVQIRLDWKTQAGDTYLALNNVKNQQEYEVLQQQITAHSEAWQERMNTYMEKSIAEVESEAATLAEERRLDLVVVDNPLTETLKYHSGEDLTLDILLRLQEKNK